MRRGNHAEIDIFPGQPVDNPLAGNVVDLCPVGALLDKDFLHKQRVWFLSKHDSICTRCSTGCNISAEENRGALWRFKPRHNPHVNDYWICDEGRYSYKAANDPDLLSADVRPAETATIAPCAVDEALKAVDRGLQGDRRAGRGRRRAVLAVPDRRGSLPAGPLPQGAEPGERAGDGADPGRGAPTRPSAPTRPRAGPATPASSSRGRSRSTPRSARTAGASRRSSTTSRARSSRYEDLTRRAAAGEFQGLYAASDAIDPWIDEAQAKALRSAVKFLVVQDTNVTPLAHLADVVLAGGDLRREGRLLRQRRRPAPVLRGGPAARATARSPTSTCSPSCSTGPADR